MNIIETLMSGAGPGMMQQLAGQFGVNAEQMTSVFSMAAPALASSLKEKVDAGGGSGILETLTSGALNKFVDHPSLLSSPAAIDTGNGFLGQLFGDADLSRLAGKVSEKSGIAVSVIQSVLPVVATTVLSFLSKKAAGNPGDVTNLITTLGGSEGMMGAVKSLAGRIFG